MLGRPATFIRNTPVTALCNSAYAEACRAPVELDILRSSWEIAVRNLVSALNRRTDLHYGTLARRGCGRGRLLREG